jgi:hypothetical protein
VYGRASVTVGLVDAKSDRVLALLVQRHEISWRHTRHVTVVNYKSVTVVKGLSRLRLGSEFGRSESKGWSRPREGERERVRQSGRVVA